MSVDDYKMPDLLANPFVAGAFGSLLGLKSMPGATWGQRFLHMAIGAGCAGYCGPALYDWLHMASESMRGGVSFAVGAFGISLFLAIRNAIQSIDWAGVITSILPASKGPKE